MRLSIKPKSQCPPRGGRVLIAWVLGIGVLVFLTQLGKAAEQDRIELRDSIRELATIGVSGLGDNGVRIVRRALSDKETTTPMEFEVALKMRNFAELQKRLASGETISVEEMTAKYFPIEADYRTISDWITSEGFSITRQSANRLTLFASGSVSQVAKSLQTTFARVAADGEEFTSAISVPSVPATLAPMLVGINGLQPHLRVRKHSPQPSSLSDSLTSNAPPFLPSQILATYGANGLGIDGTGQTIAIVIDYIPEAADLQTFWTQCHINQSLPNIQYVPVAGASPVSSDTDVESTLDVEWSSAIAPGATVMVFVTPDLSDVNLDQAYQEIYAKLPDNPGLRQVSLSYAGPEQNYSVSSIQTDAQLFASLVSAGVTVFASSGDGGSNPMLSGGNGYSSSAPLQTTYPASDQNVTAVGGTSLELNLDGSVDNERVWFRNDHGSGGGISSMVNRPLWQSGLGVPDGSTRFVPDVAVAGDPSTGAFVIFNGQTLTRGGTSWGSPTWAGFCALINQARANAGRTPLGPLNPKIYPLVGTPSFRDIITGTNGAYSAGVGYDLCTGVGVPNVANLIQVVLNEPEIATQSGNQTVTDGESAEYLVSAAGTLPFSYHWQRQAAGTTAWNNLADSESYSGTTTTTLEVATTAVMSGDQFRCIVSNSSGSTSSSPVGLGVNIPLAVTTFAGSAGNGGTADGTSGARLSYVTSIAMDGAGNIYVADFGYSTIRKISPLGVVSTLAGFPGTKGTADGTGSSARFSGPYGVAADNFGNVYVGDTGNHTIRKITSAGAVTTLAGQPGVPGTADGAGSAAQFDLPHGVAVDGMGNIYVADYYGCTIRKISPSGVVTTVAGRPGFYGAKDGTGNAATFKYPSGVAVYGIDTLFVADSGNSTIRKIVTGGEVTTVAGYAGSSGNTDGTGSSARFTTPYGVAVDDAGNVYVSDNIDHTIREINQFGVVTIPAGLATVPGSTDGTGSGALFNKPFGITADNFGNVFVADTYNFTVRKGTPIFLTPVASQIRAQPQSQSAAVGQNAVLSVTASGTPAPTFQWEFNGTALGGATNSTLAINDVEPANTGIYSVLLTNTSGATTSDPAIVGVSTTSAVIGAGQVLGTNILHPNGNHFDQVLVTGTAEAIATQGGRITRTSYIDLSDNIVQVEFSGAGTLSLVLDGATGPAQPLNYNQAVNYMKGHAGIVITGANESTNVLVFTVGRATAFDPTGTYNILLAPSATNVPANNGSPLFQGHAATNYDGVAEIAFIAIETTDGKFGGVRASNASFFASNGLTGVYAPGVAFQGPVYIGDIDAHDSATPVIILGSVSDARITGGDLTQDNGQAVQVSGITQLKFTAGSKSTGDTLPAQNNHAVLKQNGQDVTAQIVVNPNP